MATNVSAAQGRGKPETIGDRQVLRGFTVELERGIIFVTKNKSNRRGACARNRNRSGSTGPDYVGNPAPRRGDLVRQGGDDPGEEMMREIEEYIREAGPSSDVRSARPRPEDFETDAEYEAAWDQEIERRLQAYDSGKIGAIDAEVVMANLRRRLGIVDGSDHPKP